MISLIQALYMIALEPVNNFSLRSFAVEQLHLIDAAMGIRQASLLAETARSTFTNTSIPKNSWNR